MYVAFLLRFRPFFFNEIILDGLDEGLWDGLFRLFYHALCMLKLLNYCFLWFLDFLLSGAFRRVLFCIRKLHLAFVLSDIPWLFPDFLCFDHCRKPMKMPQALMPRMRMRLMMWKEKIPMPKLKKTRTARTKKKYMMSCDEEALLPATWHGEIHLGSKC